MSTPYPFGDCKVCGDKASGIHYGVASCEACKGFFKRTFIREIKYRCYFGGECPVTATNRNRCKACRYALCINNGMAMDAVKMGRIPKLKKERALKDLEKVSQPNNATAEVGNDDDMSSVFDCRPLEKDTLSYPAQRQFDVCKSKASNKDDFFDSTSAQRQNSGFNTSNIHDPQSFGTGTMTRFAPQRNKFDEFPMPNAAQNSNPYVDVPHMSHTNTLSTLPKSGDYGTSTTHSTRQNDYSPVTTHFPQIGDINTETNNNFSSNNFSISSVYTPPNNDINIHTINSTQTSNFFPTNVSHCNGFAPVSSELTVPVNNEPQVSRQISSAKTYSSETFQYSLPGIGNQFDNVMDGDIDMCQLFAKNSFATLALDDLLDITSAEFSNSESTSSSSSSKTSISPPSQISKEENENALVKQFSGSRREKQIIDALFSAENSCQTLFKVTVKCRQIIQKHLSKERILPSTPPIHSDESWKSSVNSIFTVSTNNAAFSRTIPGFLDLSQSDQETMLKRAYLDLWVLTSLDFFVKGESYIVIGLEEDENGKFIYDAETIRGVMGNDFCNDFFLLCDDFRQMELSDYELTLIAIIQLTDVDEIRKNLKDVQKIKDIQNLHVDALSHYMSKTHTSKSGRMLIEIFQLVRRMSVVNATNFRILQKLPFS